MTITFISFPLITMNEQEFASQAWNLLLLAAIDAEETMSESVEYVRIQSEDAQLPDDYEDVVELEIARKNLSIAIRCVQDIAD